MELTRTRQSYPKLSGRQSTLTTEKGKILQAKKGMQEHPQLSWIWLVNQATRTRKTQNWFPARLLAPPMCSLDALLQAHWLEENDDIHHKSKRTWSTQMHNDILATFFNFQKSLQLNATHQNWQKLPELIGRQSTLTTEKGELLQAKRECRRTRNYPASEWSTKLCAHAEHETICPLDSLPHQCVP